MIHVRNRSNDRKYYEIDRMIGNIDGNSGDDGDGYGRGNGLYAPNVMNAIDLK